MVGELDLEVSDADFQRVRDVVHAHCGIALDDRKKELVRARIARQIRSGSFKSAAEYLKHALSDPSNDAFTQFIDSISTNLTSFFRERQHFDYLTTALLPHLCAVKNKNGDSRLRVWSAACSTGEEPYSLAMTLLDAVKGPCARDMRILATDISTRVLEIAGTGSYRESQLSSLPAGYLQRFFTRNAATSQQEAPAYTVSPQIRGMVSFRHLNLMEAWPFTGPFDFIFCRNVMIYFDKPTQERLVDRYWNCLRPGGILFTGHSESLIAINHRFINRKPSIYEKP